MIFSGACWIIVVGDGGIGVVAIDIYVLSDGEHALRGVDHHRSDGSVLQLSQRDLSAGDGDAG